MVSTLTSPEDQRGSRKRTVGASDKLVFDITSGVTKTLDLSHLSGQVVGMEYICPNLTTDATFDVAFFTKNDILIHDETGLADTKVAGFYKNFFTDNLFIPPDSKLRVTYTTSQTATIEVLLHMK